MTKITPVTRINCQLKEFNKLSIDQLKNKEQDTKFKQAGGKATLLVEKFKSPSSYKFYCKAAYLLPQGTIDRLSTTALEKGKNPGAYFNCLVNKELSNV